MDDAAIVAEIRERVTSGQYEVDFEHVDFHVAMEGFALRDVEQAVDVGQVIEVAPDRDRWLFCARIRSLRQDARFLGQWLHVSIERTEDAEVVVVTAYRPDRGRWLTERRRR
jgi:hypothetical protein